jgi:hypothetical protein
VIVDADLETVPPAYPNAAAGRGSNAGLDLPAPRMPGLLS